MKNKSLIKPILIPTFILNTRFDKLVDVLDEIIALRDDESMVTANKVLSKPEFLSLLIKGISNSPSMLSRTLAGSYYHENGFHKIVLLSGKFFKLRLHHFGVSAKIPMENIHDHRWAFASTILKGDLKMDLFMPTQKGSRTEKAYHFIYEADKSSGNYNTEFISVAHLKKSESRTYRAGDTYLMNTHELHRIRNTSGQESITLMLTGKPLSSKCNLFARRMILEDEKKTISYGEEKMIDMLEAISEKIYPQKN